MNYHKLNLFKKNSKGTAMWKTHTIASYRQSGQSTKGSGHVVFMESSANGGKCSWSPSSKFTGLRMGRDSCQMFFGQAFTQLSLLVKFCSSEGTCVKFSISIHWVYFIFYMYTLSLFIYFKREIEKERDRERERQRERDRETERETENERESEAGSRL